MLLHSPLFSERYPLPARDGAGTFLLIVRRGNIDEGKQPRLLHAYGRHASIFLS
ncbi:MAG: hypothetical protein WBA12_07075 [Catalinimonas sp.]